MGEYQATRLKVQHVPVYKQLGGISGGAAQYLFMDPDGKWAVGPDPTRPTGAGLRQMYRNTDPASLVWDSWQFYGVGGWAVAKNIKLQAKGTC